MKKLILLFNFVCCLLNLYSQNVGINNTSPSEKLTVNGNMLVAPPVTKSKGLPDGEHTFSMIANNTDTFLIVKDSVYRVLDPGGTGNYSANTTSGILLADTTGNANGEISGGYEISFDSINLAANDSIYIINQNIHDILFRGGSNLNGTHPVFSGNYLGIYLVSAAGSPGAPGFSAVVRKQYVNRNAAGTGGSSSTYISLFFNSLTGGFKSGIGNSTNLGSGAFEIGTNCVASGYVAGAMGYGSSATNYYDLAMAGGSASGGNSVAIGLATVCLGNNSIALGTASRADAMNSTAIGGAYTSGYNSMAAGAHSKGYGSYSIALAGGITTDAGAYGVAIGPGSVAGNNYAIAIGNSANASGLNSMSLGYLSTASVENAAAFGANAHATGYASVALGSSGASGSYSTSMGSSGAHGSYSTAMGKNCSVNGEASFAAGSLCNTGAANCVAIGTSVSANAVNSIAIGNNVTADGTRSTAMGNYCSTSGHTGAFTIGDNSTTTIMQTFEDNAFRARFAKGFRFYTTSDVTIGAYLNQGANSWATLSDKRVKENFVPVDGEIFLHNIAAMPLTTWNYIGQDVKTFRHYGPMAQDFFAAFGKDELGVIGCDTLINQQDFLGVNLIAIQALEKRTTDLKKENLALKDQNEKFKNENEKLEARLKKLEDIMLKK